jgi:hypothetical protein
MFSRVSGPGDDLGHSCGSQKPGFRKGVWGIKFIAPEFMMAWFCHPSMLIALSPASNQLDSEFMANPMPSPMTTSPSTIEGAYDLRSLILPRT